MTDGVFAFAMTLLVISLDLPDSFQPASSDELLAKLSEFDDAMLAYVISFVVLAVRWIGLVQIRGKEPETVGGARTWIVLIGLFFVTIMPFATTLVARYGDYWPSIWVYAANMIAAGCVSLGAAHLTAKEGGKPLTFEERLDIWVLIVAAALSAALSPFIGSSALYAYGLNLLAPVFARIMSQKPAH